MKRNLLVLSLLATAIAAPACGKKGADGIPECDAYFKTIASCQNASEKSSLELASNLEKDAWKHLDREKIKEACVERGKYATDRCDVGWEGVADCEAYFKIIETCSNETQKKNAAQFREQWKTRPKSTLAGACKTSLDMATKFCK